MPRISFTEKKILRGISQNKNSSTHHRKKIGLPPGSLVFIGDKKQEHVNLSLISYDRNILETKKLTNISEYSPCDDKNKTIWLNIDGLHDIAIIKDLESVFGIHSLALEDCLNTAQHPKMEEYDDTTLLILKMLSVDQKTGVVHAEQVSFFLGENFVISLQEKEGDVFHSIRERLNNSNGRLRKSGPDYLLSALLDSIVDNYFIVTEYFAGQLEKIDEELLDEFGSDTLQEIYQLKKNVISIRRLIFPLRDAMRELLSGEQNPLINESTEPYFRDIYDHLYQVVDSLDIYRDMMSSMMDLYLSNLGHRTNEVMKVLTIIATIFIPLTFIAGLYGMNFQYMPELQWKYGYFAVLGIMTGIAAIMIAYFKRKRWL